MRKTLVAGIACLMLAGLSASAQSDNDYAATSCDSTNVQTTEIGKWVITRRYEESSSDDDYGEGVTKNSSVKFDISRSRDFDTHYHTHYPIYYMSLSDLCHEPFDFSADNGFDLNHAKSWNWGIYLFQDGFAFGPKEHLGLTWALGFGRTLFKMAEPYSVGHHPGSDYMEIDFPIDPVTSKPYAETWFRYWTLNLPISLQYQTTAGGEELFFNIGPEVEYHFSPCSKGRSDGNGKKQVITKNINMRPLGVNALAEVGYGDFTFIAKASLTGLFNGYSIGSGLYEGEHLCPVTFGIGLTF